MLPAVETRVCEACLEEKLTIDFYVHGGRNRQPSKLCKQCENRRKTEYSESNVNAHGCMRIRKTD